MNSMFNNECKMAQGQAQGQAQDGPSRPNMDQFGSQMGPKWNPKMGPTWAPKPNVLCFPGSFAIHRPERSIPVGRKI